MGSTSLGGMWVLEPGWGDRAVFQLGNGSGHCRSLPLPALHEEEWCAVSRNWGHPLCLIPLLHRKTRAAHRIFLASLQSSTGELPGLPAVLRNRLGICRSPVPVGEGWVTARLGQCVLPGLWGSLSSFSFSVSLENSQDSLLGLLSWFQDGCKALPVLSSCLSTARSASAPWQGCWVPSVVLGGWHVAGGAAQSYIATASPRGAPCALLAPRLWLSLQQAAVLQCGSGLCCQDQSCGALSSCQAQWQGRNVLGCSSALRTPVTLEPMETCSGTQLGVLHGAWSLPASSVVQ